MTPTVLFLGASPQQVAPILSARKAGYRIVTCDNRPGNPGHALADATYDVSTLDRAEVLRVATKERISGIVCYASDVSAATAAHVAQALGLPGNPPASVELLTDKDAFRAWQRRLGYFAPAHVALDRLGDPAALATRIVTEIDLPVVVKPVDASGGKGISTVRHAADLPAAIVAALAGSPSGRAVAESFVPRQGMQICGEGFLVDGRIAFVAFADEHFTPGLHVPIGETFPTVHDDAFVSRGTQVLQDMFERLGMRHGAFNFDLMLADTGDIFVVEIGPRAGGNRMPEAAGLAYGIDLVGATVESALGRPVEFHPHPPRPHATYSVHSREDGVLERIELSPRIAGRLVDGQQYVAAGEPVHRFVMGNRMISSLILSFESPEEMVATMAEMDTLVHVVLARAPADA